jgi:protein-tyrosine phosphatase
MINNIKELIEKINIHKIILYKIPKPLTYDINNISILLNNKIYFGSYYNVSNNITLLKNFGITHIINLSQNKTNLFINDFKYFTFKIPDLPLFNFSTLFDDIINLIINIIKNNGILYIHCAKGISRSATILIAFIGKLLNLDFITAYKYVFIKRPCIKPNIGFCIELIEYFDKINTK